MVKHILKEKMASFNYKKFVQGQQGSGVGWVHPIYRRGTRTGAGFGSFFKKVISNPTFQKVAKRVGRAAYEGVKDVASGKKSVKQAMGEQATKVISGQGKTKKQAGKGKKTGKVQKGAGYRNKKQNIKSASNQKKTKILF